MMNITITWRFIVGIDISKKLLDIYLFDRKTGAGYDCQALNNPKGFAQPGRWLQAYRADPSQTLLLSEHIDELEERIAEQITSDPALRQRYRTLQGAPGMGKVLTPLWLSLFADQQTLNPRKIASRFGFAPHPHRSGSSVRSRDRSSGFGNSEVRRVMHQAALSVKTHYPHYQAYYNQKKAEGKEHLLVINNIINKLIRLYCAMWNNRSEYDPNYIQKMKEQYKKSA